MPALTLHGFRYTQRHTLPCKVKVIGGQGVGNYDRDGTGDSCAVSDDSGGGSHTIRSAINPVNRPAHTH